MAEAVSCVRRTKTAGVPRLLSARCLEATNTRYAFDFIWNSGS